MTENEIVLEYSWRKLANFRLRQKMKLSQNNFGKLKLDSNLFIPGRAEKVWIWKKFVRREEGRGI